MQITQEQGFVVLTKFLSQFWDEHRVSFNDDLPDLLSSMILMSDGRPADPAVWSYWLDCVSSTLDEAAAFAALKCFLNQYRQIGEGKNKDITHLLSWIEDNAQAAQELWSRSLQD